MILLQLNTIDEKTGLKNTSLTDRERERGRGERQKDSE